MKLFHFVYITFRLNSPYYYIGVHSTDNILDGYVGSGYHLLNAVRKYGKQNFARYIIKYFDSHQEALKYENSLITKEMLSDKYCYNIQPGGKGSKEEHTLSTRDKISIARKGKTMPKKPDGYINPLKGTRRPESVKLKISNTCKKLDMGQYNRGRKLSDLTRQKMSASHKKVMTDEMKARISRKVSGENNGFYGKHHTVETRQFLSQLQKERFTNKDERLKISEATKQGMIKSDKWNKHLEDLRAGKITGSMKGKKNPNLGKSMKYAMHIRWHIKRNIINKECEYCVTEKLQ